jgi:MFS family permease
MFIQSYSPELQFSGINAFVYYAPTLFKNLGQGYERSLILSGMINVGQLVGVVPTTLFIDQMGRRPLAIWGAIGMAIPHAIMAGLTAQYGNDWPAHPGVGWFCVALVCKFIVLFGSLLKPFQVDSVN